MEDTITSGMFLGMMWQQSVIMNPKLEQVTHHEWIHAFLNCSNTEQEDALFQKYLKWKTENEDKSE